MNKWMKTDEWMIYKTVQWLNKEWLRWNVHWDSKLPLWSLSYHHRKLRSSLLKHCHKYTTPHSLPTDNKNIQKQVLWHLLILAKIKTTAKDNNGNIIWLISERTYVYNRNFNAIICHKQELSSRNKPWWFTWILASISSASSYV